MDADRGIGLGPDHQRQFARFSRALRRARAGLDQEVLAALRLRRLVVGGPGGLGLGRALRRDLGPERVDARQRRAGGRSGVCRARRRPQLVVDVARELALDAREARDQGLQNALQLRETRLGAPVGARLLGSELGQMGAERGMERGQRLRRVRARRRLSLTQPLEQLPHHRLRIVGPDGLRRQRVDAIVDSGDLPGKSLRIVVSGVEILKTTSDLVGDAHGDLPIHERRTARLELGLERMQQGLDRIEIDRGGDRIEPRAEVAENRLKPARADLGVGEAIELAAEFAQNRLEPAHAGVGVGEPIELDADLGRHRLEGARVGVRGAGGFEFGVEITHELFDRAGVDRSRRARFERLTHVVDASRQVVERARIDRGRSARASDFLIEPRRDLFQTPLDRRQRLGRRGAFDLPPRFGQKRGHLGRLEMGRGACAELARRGRRVRRSAAPSARAARCAKRRKRGGCALPPSAA